MTSNSRTQLLKSIAGLIARTPVQGSLKVAIDGVDGGGQKAFADELATFLTGLGKEVVRSSNESPTKGVPGSILLVDGIFLHRPEIVNFWDFSVFLALQFEASDPDQKHATMVIDNSDPSSPQVVSTRFTNANEVHQAALKKKTFTQKWEQVCALRDVAWNLKAARLRSQHPDWMETQVQDTVRKIFLYGST